MSTEKTQALIPFFEDNQGLLTLLALVLALAAFFIENQRANKAEQHSRSEARRQEALDRQRALDIEKREANRAREVHHQRITEFVVAVRLLIDVVITEIDEGIRTSNVAMWRAHAKLPEQAMGVAGSLDALLPAAPLDPTLILTTQRASAAAMGLAALSQNSLDGIAANNALTTAKEKLLAIKTELTNREVELLSR